MSSQCTVCQHSIPPTQQHRRDLCVNCRSLESYCTNECCELIFCCRGGCTPGWYCAEMVTHLGITYYCEDCLTYTQATDANRQQLGYKQCIDCQFHVIEPGLRNARCVTCFIQAPRLIKKYDGRLCKACKQHNITPDADLSIKYCVRCIKLPYCNGLKQLDGYRFCKECRSYAISPNQTDIDYCHFCSR